MKKLTKKEVTDLVNTLRALAPKRPLSYGDALQVARLQAARLRTWADANERPDFNLGWFVNQKAYPVHFVPRATLGDNNSGLTTNAVSGHVEIYINEAEPDVRQRFSLAHEMKHLVDFDDYDTLYSRLGSGNESRHQAQIELICNDFAAHLLMPTPLVKRLWSAFQDIDTVALHFNVSPEAMRTRLVKLGLIDRPAPRARTLFRESSTINSAEHAHLPCAA